MPTPIELALATLLPTVSFLPPDLITLSNSLLAQSRAKAASLKPEEEISRTYACCHIACERLKKRLDLEIGRPAPPVKPRVYEKLFRYLDGVLTTPVTPRRDKGRDALRGSSKTPNTATRRARDVERTPTTGEKRRRVEIEASKEEGNEDEVPDFAMPMVRAICKANGTPSAVPHILVGATAVMREIASRNSGRGNGEGPARKRRRTPQSGKSAASEGPSINSGVAVSKWPALLIALHVLVAAKMRGLDSEDEEMKITRKKGIETVKAYCKEKHDTLPEDIAATLNQLESNIGFYILEGEDYGWLDMEWYQNVPLSEQEATAEDEIEEAQAAEDLEDDVPTPRRRPYKTPLGRKEKHGGKAAFDLHELVGAAGLQSGLGTMFQPAVDWLSDERRKDFAQWQKGILRKINAIEASS